MMGERDAPMPRPSRRGGDERAWPVPVRGDVAESASHRSLDAPMLAARRTGVRDDRPNFAGAVTPCCLRPPRR